MPEIYVIAHDIRSAHNIGSLLRTAEGLGINKVIISGYSPYPIKPNDSRLPHIAKKVDARISKTALGAETMIAWDYSENIDKTIRNLKADGFIILALEQAHNSVKLNRINSVLNLQSDSKLALVLGREVDGLSDDLIKLADYIVEIPMYGQKESYNVIEAATMAMYQLRHSC